VSEGLRVVLAGGGTAGHVEPALAVADALMREDPSTLIVFLGTEQGLEARLVPERGYRLMTIPRVPLPRKPGREMVRLPGRLRAAVRACGQVIDDQHADVVVGFGGYVAAPAYWAARRRKLPIVVHEANVRPGVANRWGARWAARVLVGFPGTDLPGAELVGMPLRRSLTALDRQHDRSGARASLGLDPDRPTVLAFGGSQGASSLNRVVPRVAAAVAAAGGQLLLAAGRGRVDEARANVVAEQTSGADHCVIVEYLDRMDLAYRAADVVVARAGAMTVAELTALGLPAVYVPLPIGNGEQALNAAPVVAAGGGVTILDADLTQDSLERALLPLLTDQRARERMGQNAALFGRLDADEVTAAIVRQVVKENVS
jgi:UDP-N-acetylglucosamine--N-acetylmuramyl-(pentapeptide) pyrophosphoryl-undecaprenol N-acetylglucosamine transferase